MTIFVKKIIMNMQTLVFNSTEKTAVLQEGFRGMELLNFKDVPTVKVENGY